MPLGLSFLSQKQIRHTDAMAEIRRISNVHKYKFIQLNNQLAK